MQPLPRFGATGRRAIAPAGAADRRCLPRKDLLSIAGALSVLLTVLAPPALANRIEAPVHRISLEGVHEQVGTVVAVQRVGFMEFTLHLYPFPPGWHAMHVHDRPACGPGPKDGAVIAGGAAGPHFDPTGVMAGMPGMGGNDMGDMGGKGTMATAASMSEKIVPGGEDKRARKPRPLGDLPTIHTDANGRTDRRILSYRLDVDQIRGRSLILHAYQEVTDDPRLPKGGGDRIACAVFPD